MAATIKVKCFNGKAYDVDVTPESDRVQDLQTRVAELSDIPAERQTLLFKGKVLDADSLLSSYSVAAGATISVVRRVGKAAPASSKPSLSESAKDATDKGKAPGAKSDAASATPSPEILPTPPTAADGAQGMEALEAMMRSLGMSAGAQGFPGMPGMGDMGTLGEAGAGGVPGGMDRILSQMPTLMNGLMQSPALQDYLNDPSKQEASRDAILQNPLLKSWLEADPEFAKVVNDPDQWRKSMEAAKSLFPPAEGGGEDKEESGEASAASSRPTAAEIAPPGINVTKLAESYGHALGQSLVNSGLGLDPSLVMKGFKAACDGKPFPMSIPEYERSIAKLQEKVVQYLEKANLEDADKFFSEINGVEPIVTIEEGKIAYERGDVEPDTEKPMAKADSTVLVIVTGRLLDDRHFFTCPAADETGEVVHPLTLPLDTAPPALAKGIAGMRESESRLLYVHPTAADGMTEMFGDLLPPNALLIFDLQLVSASAPEEEVAAVKKAAAEMAAASAAGADAKKADGAAVAQGS